MFWIIPVLAAVITGLWIYSRWHHGYLEKKGIPVVEYSNPIMGHVWDIYTRAGGLLDVEWMRKYGDIFGIYEGRQPVIYVANPKLLQEICVKNADHFDSKRSFDFGDQYINELTDFLPQYRWRVIRPLMTSVFSTARLRMMNLPMREATQDFVEDMKDKLSKTKNGVLENVSIDGALHSMLTDLVGRALFSIKRDRSSKGEDSELVKIVKEMLTPAPLGMTLYFSMVGHAFPFLRKIFPQLLFPPEPISRFVKIFQRLMDERRQSGENHGDLLDICITWWDKLNTEEFRKVNITKSTLFMQSLVFASGAQDQMSSILAGVIYNLVQDPELEKNIYKEVDEVFKKNNGQLESEHLTQLKLLQSCIFESTRLYTIFHKSDRYCTKDWRSEEFNLNFKKGDIVNIPVYALNRHDSIDRPDEFDAERYLPENKDKLNPHWNTSHGIGPRSCISRGFAQKLLPVVLAYILKDLKFVKRENTKFTHVNGGFFMTVHEPVYVDVMKRE